MRVRLQTSSQGFVVGVGHGSVSILRMTLRFTINFNNGKDFGLDGEKEGTGTDQDRGSATGKSENDKVASGTGGEAGNPGEENLLSLSLTMTITIMAIN
ncbi:hypothetical protein SAMD00023353_3800530 [Rosellinia necatrix]|uniref:Uncharacterized protein n=1 Tax=Rosellinia necatrix TaxID=77044 RepID=A0A1W2TMH4_ROSNE|nr:hypothetical protein SAMD00023353_3800530 [Rosellinia necatrix]